MRKVSRWITLAAVAVVSLACSSTTFQSTWKAPDAKPVQLAGRKVVGIFLSKSPDVRRRAEDAMARELSARGAQGVAAYTILSDEEVKNQDASKEKLGSLGFEGAIVMRVVGRETQYNYEPAIWGGPHYRHFWGGYWGWGWGTVWAPGYLTSERVVKVETLVYSLTQDELIWSAVSKTVDPNHIDGLVSDLAKAVSDEMEKEGLLKKS
jgi:hypothetical protein